MPNTEKRDNTRVQILPTDNPMEYLQKQWELAARKSREEKQREEAAKNIESIWKLLNRDLMIKICENESQKH